MGIVRDYLRFVLNGTCNIVGSNDGVVQAIDNVTCAVTACENVNFFNMRTLEKTHQISNEGKKANVFKANTNRSLIAIGYDNGEVHLYKRTKKNEDEDFYKFAGHRTGVNTLSFSNDDLMLASGGKDSVIVIWDIVNESGMFRLNGHKDSITQLQFTIDNKHLVSSSKDFQLKFWNIASQSCFYTIADSVSEIYSFGLFNLDRLLVIGSADVELLVYELSWLDRFVENYIEDTENNKIVKKSKNIELLVGSNYISDENSQANLILSVKKRGTLLRQAKGRALQIAITFDQLLLCCVGGDSIDVFRIFTPEESCKRFEKKVNKERRKREREGINGSLFENEIAKDVTLLITRIGSYTSNAKIKWIDFCNGSKLLDDFTREYRMYCLYANNDVQGIKLKLLKSNEFVGESIVSLGQRGHRTDVKTIVFSSTNTTFISGAGESAILWDFNSLLPKCCLTDELMKNITASLFSPNDREAILGTKDGNIFTFDLAECELIYNNKNAHDGAITSIVALPKNDGFVSVGLDKKAKFWYYEFKQIFDKKLLSLRLDQVLELQDEVLCVAVSPNSKFIVFGLLDNTARVHYLDTLRFFVSLYGHSLPIYSIDISSDSKLVITGSGDKTVKIWGLDFGDCHKSIFAHDDTVSFVKFCPKFDVEETLFWSAGKDGKIIQWDAIKFNKIQTLSGHKREIQAFNSTSDGRMIISASHDKSIRIWELTDEIINLKDEEENEREKEYDERLLDAEDIVPGESIDQNETGMASVKTLDSIKSTESILECIDILRNEILDRENNSKHKPHILLMPYKNDKLDFFVLDVLQKVRSSHLEKSLLMVPFSYVSDILKSLNVCVKCNYRVELCCRIILFLIKIHHSQILNSVELLPIVEQLNLILPKKISFNLDQIGFNLAALRFFQLNLEERNNVKLFRDVSAVEKDKKKKKLKKMKVKDSAVIKV